MHFHDNWLYYLEFAELNQPIDLITRQSVLLQDLFLNYI